MQTEWSAPPDVFVYSWLPSYFSVNSLHRIVHCLESPAFPSFSILPCLEVADCHPPGMILMVSCCHSLEFSSFLLRHFNNFVALSLFCPLLGCFKESIRTVFSKHDSKTSSISITWELLRNVNSQVPTQTFWVIISGVGPNNVWCWYPSIALWHGFGWGLTTTQIFPSRFQRKTHVQRILAGLCCSTPMSNSSDWRVAHTEDPLSPLC